ncbi:nucleic acid dioxygenase ALKBH1-like [Haliotis cracherodii]|uniref:nucleic acid dioxygenase ALKBH1-like n=1 Tax=Haliotis cracherodii TaxID=6455 RepID=UPI0039E81843
MTEETDHFRHCFKYFKARNPPPQYSSVIDFNKLSNQNSSNSSNPCDVEVSEVSLDSPATPLPLGLKPVTNWQAFTLNKHPGFVVIRNPFEVGFQRYWIKRCLQDYHLPPNVTNLDPHLERSLTARIFDDFAKQDREELQKDDLLMRLRWVTLGYHYDWTAKKYYADKHSEFPADLSVLSCCITEALGYTNFKPEAAIVNYYHMDSTLAGHTDHSEFHKQAPLLSVSFGQDAIFLLGGKTKAMPPSAMYLRSGDICVMGGESRMAYHAVPRILAATNPTYMDWNSQGEVTPSPADTQDPNRGSSSDMDACIKQEMNRMNWKPLNVFLKTSRINVNIRQVLKPGQTFPEEHGKVDNVPLADGTVQEMPVTKRFKLSDS